MDIASYSAILIKKELKMEKLKLGIPVLPIFVYKCEDGLWEVVYGLQRLSTILLCYFFISLELFD